MSRIEARPTEGLSYRPAEAKYWDPQGLEGEIERVFDICHGCRLCFNLCPSFPTLFEAIDAADGDVRALSAATTDQVVDRCYGCKLCELKCPYTPRDGHEFQLDFPRLMERARALRVREHGLGFRERILGNPDLLGKVGSLTPTLANLGCRSRFQRVIMERLLGIHRDKRLPEFAHQTFDAWIRSTGLPSAPADPAARVVIFATCFVNYYNPEPGKAAVEVMAKNRCAMACPKQNCCGMPALDGGDVKFAEKQARQNVRSMLSLVRRGYKIAAINPTCSMTMRQEYPSLIDGEDVREFSAAVVDTGEMLFSLRRAGSFNRDFRSTPLSVAYHVPCHLKAQGVGLRSRDLMRSIPGASITTVDACTAHDGTWAMKKEFFDLSMTWGEKAFSGMRDATANVMATDCPLAAVQIEQATGVRPIHPLEVLARAYREDGFPDRVEQAGEGGEEQK